MTTCSPTRSRVQSAATWLAQVLSITILAFCLSQCLLLLLDVLRYYSSVTIWLMIEAAVPVYFFGMLGITALLRRRPGGLTALCIATAISMIEWVILRPPIVSTLIPQFIPGTLGFWLSCFPSLVLLVLAYFYASAAQTNSQSSSWQFSLRGLVALVVLTAMLIRCGVGQPRAEVAAQKI